MDEVTVQTEWNMGASVKAPAAGDRAGEKATPRLKPVDRQQVILRMVDVEQLLEGDHPARAIWEFTGRVDWRGYYASIQAVEGVAGRQAWDPRLLGSLWIYAYSRGIDSAREVARRCDYDPGFQWLTGLQGVNYHTLADFRVSHKSRLDELFTQVLGILSSEGLISLERVTQDGTKIKACAGKDSFRREQRLQAHLQAARVHVEAMGDPRAEPSARRRAAQQRAQRERVQRLEQAAAELAKLQESHAASAAGQVRVSETDPEARVMKQGDGGYAPSYNVQLSTDAAHGLIVGAGVTQAGNDVGELVPAVQRIEQNMGRKPQQMVSDGGYTTRENVLAMEAQGVELIGSLSSPHPTAAGQMESCGVQDGFRAQAFRYDAVQDVYRCPAGELLPHVGEQKRPGIVQHHYRARGVCAACRFKAQCCPNSQRGRTIVRTVEYPAVQAFRAKMQTAAARAVYRLRGPVAEFPNAWIKSKIGLRQFRLRGLVKVGMETLWACLTYNIQQWMRLRWRTQWQRVAA